MPTYALAIVSAVLGIVVVYGVRGIAYAMSDDDFAIAAIAFFVGGGFTLCALGGDIAAYYTLAGRQSDSLLAGAGAGTLVGGLIVVWLFHNWSETRFRRWYPPRHYW